MSRVPDPAFTFQLLTCFHHNTNTISGPTTDPDGGWATPSQLCNEYLGKLQHQWTLRLRPMKQVKKVGFLSSSYQQPK